MRVKYSYRPLWSNQPIQVLVLTIAANCRNLLLRVIQAKLPKNLHLSLPQSRSLQISQIESRELHDLHRREIKNSESTGCPREQIILSTFIIDWGRWRTWTLLHLRLPHAFADFPRKNKNCYAQTDKATGSSYKEINNRYCHTQINLKTNLQTVAIRLSLHKTIITLCSV